MVGQLRNAKADRRETERERKMAEAVAHMKQLFPGVHIVPMGTPLPVPLSLVRSDTLA